MRKTGATGRNAAQEATIDALTILRLHGEWGVDEALDDVPVNRLRAAGPAPGLPDAFGAPDLAAPELVGSAPAPSPPMSVLPAKAAAPARSTPAQRAEAVAAACATLSELVAALESFTGCALAATATNLVFSDGNPEAGLMLVGEGPGAEEDRAGKPFVGPSGQFLDRMLASIGLDRSKLVVTNLIPWRPPGNRNPTEAEVLTCLPFLHRHIALVRPRRLVLLGALASRALLGGELRHSPGAWPLGGSNRPWAQPQRADATNAAPCISPPQCRCQKGRVG